MQWTSILTKEKFSFCGNLAKRSEGNIFVRRDLFEKVDKNSGFTNCAASVFNHIAAGHGTRAFVGLLPAETRFSQSVTRSLWSKQLSRCFYRANTGLNQYFIRRKTIEITPFFSLSSLLSSLSFFLSQGKWKLHLSSSLCTIQTCFIDYRTLQLQLKHVSILSLKSSVSTTSILVYHYTCTRLVSNFSLSLSLTTLSRWPEFRQVYHENMLLFDSLFFGIKVRNWVGSMNESQGLRVKEEVFKVYN